MKLLLLLVALHAPTQGVQQGIAKFYSRGVMEHVAAYRHLCRWDSQGKCRPPYGATGFASRVSCKTIGQRFSARINGHTERLLQVDCSQYRDAPRHIREGLIVEVDYPTAKRDGLLPRRHGSGPATVYNW